MQLSTLQGQTSSGTPVSFQLGELDNPPPISAADNDKLLQTLYLLDRFGVGDAFYHELTMLQPELPRSYKVKRARADLNNTVDIENIPGFDGAFRPFESTLKQQLSALVS